jgi:redox-sensing transcriptional repressor
VITTPAPVAQDVADRLVDAGATAILNFAPTVLSVPSHVSIRKVDLSIELQILAFYQQRSDGHESGPRAAPVRARANANGEAGGRVVAP